MKLFVTPAFLGEFNHTKFATDFPEAKIQMTADNTVFIFEVEDPILGAEYNFNEEELLLLDSRFDSEKVLTLVEKYGLEEYKNKMKEVKEKAETVAKNQWLIDKMQNEYIKLLQDYINTDVVLGSFI
jgi:hypothetical protein